MVRNPFNGIERTIGALSSLLMNSKGIHLMELKDSFYGLDAIWYDAIESI
jgi:hypothetical protein